MERRCLKRGVCCYLPSLFFFHVSFISFSVDDGEMLSVFKEYFTNIAEPKRTPAATSADPNVDEPGSYTEFDLLLSTAYNEFSMITEDLVVELRGPSTLKVAHHIGEFSRKLQIRAFVFFLNSFPSFPLKGVTLILCFPLKALES